MDPVLGRFISPDTIVPNAGNGQDYNRYAYVNNRPIVFNDPTGHDYCEGGGGGCGGVRGPGQGVFNPETGRRDALDANGDGIVCSGGWGISCEDSWQRTPPVTPTNRYEGSTLRGRAREILFWATNGKGQDNFFSKLLPQGWVSGIARAYDVRDQAHEAANPFRERPGDQDSPDTPKSNAVRHATLSALLAFDLDGESAWDLVESHERFIQQNELDTAIDRANNRKGIELGERARAQGLTVEELKASVLAEYDGGGLFCDREGAVAAC